MTSSTRRLVLIALACMVGGCHQSPSSPTQLGTSTPNSTYYVALHEAGADNDRCDGSSPTNSGNGHCPFKDFTSARTLHLLDNGSGVKVYVRQGTYVLSQHIGIHGAGASEADRILLSAFEGESAVIDGAAAVREVIVVSGRYVTVRGLTVRNSAGYNLEVRGGSQVVIEDNRFLDNRSSDSLKGDGGSSDVVVRNNEFSGWDSQAIDLTGVMRWTIEGNRFHDSHGVDANAIGMKFGTRDVTVAGNTFTDTQGMSLGGVSSAHAEPFEAYGLVVTRNTFRNIDGAAVRVFSCSGCRFENNVIDGAGGGLRVYGRVSQGASGCAGGCQPSENLMAAGNQIRNLLGGADGPPDVFWGVDASEMGALSPSNNTYCARAAGAGRFWLSGTFVGFSEWVRAVPTDATSVAAARTDERCTAF